MSAEVIAKRQVNIFSAISRVTFRRDDVGVRFFLDQHVELNCYHDGSLKQQSTGRRASTRTYYL